MTILEPSTRIYVAGHTGLVGSALLRRLRAGGYENLLLRTREELDLTDQRAVARFFADENPECVILAAARVGGILANDSFPAEFIRDNVAIQTHVIHEAWRARVPRLLFLGSSCIYPRDCPQPIREEYLLTGPLESTNRAYAIAKIAGIEMCWSYNRQFHTRFLAVMPSNLYGPGDNYDLETSHVLPALIRKMHEARVGESDSVELWGTGTPRREFLYSEDLADACVFLLELDDADFGALVAADSLPLLNVGYGEDRTIAELAALVAEVTGYTGEIVWDSTRPDGTPRKLMDSSRVAALGWRPVTSLRDGIALSYRQALRDGALAISDDEPRSAQSTPPEGPRPGGGP